MNKIVVNGASLVCTGGSILSHLQVETSLLVNGKPVATIQNGTPNNVGCFGYCKFAGSICTPMTRVWNSTGPTLNNLTILNQDATLDCTIGGKITIVDPGQTVANST